jgi:hypothetical protein
MIAYGRWRAGGVGLSWSVCLLGWSTRLASRDINSKALRAGPLKGANAELTTQKGCDLRGTLRRSGIVKLRALLAGLVATIGVAAPAHADGVDDTFLATVKAAGITFQDPGKAIGAARWVCSMAGQGKQMADLVKTIQAQNPGLTGDNAARFTAIAANTYCPEALGH